MKVRLTDEQARDFDRALSEYRQIVKRDVPKNEFAIFAMFWFIDGFLRDDVDDDPEESVCL